MGLSPGPSLSQPLLHDVPRDTRSVNPGDVTLSSPPLGVSALWSAADTASSRHALTLGDPCLPKLLVFPLPLWQLLHFVCRTVCLRPALIRDPGGSVPGRPPGELCPLPGDHLVLPALLPLLLATHCFGSSLSSAPDPATNDLLNTSTRTCHRHRRPTLAKCEPWEGFLLSLP